MGKFLKQGKVVVVLQGRFAGRKAVIVKSYDDGTPSRKFGHVLVAGIDKGPKKLTRKMSEKKIKQRSRVRPFVKMINYNHIMPTRYQVDLDLKKLELQAKAGEDAVVLTLDEETVADAGKRASARKAVKKVFQEGYFAQDKRKNQKAQDGVEYFYQKLRF